MKKIIMGILIGIIISYISLVGRLYYIDYKYDYESDYYNCDWKVTDFSYENENVYRAEYWRFFPIRDGGARGVNCNK